MKWTLLFAVVFPLVTFAGPPFVTDDPEPVEYHHYELYFSTQFVRASDSDVGALPLVEFNYGIMEDVQVHVVGPMMYSRASGGPSQYGYGDTELGLKYRFIHETDSRPQVGIFPMLEIPSGSLDRGTGNGNPQLFLPVWLQKSWGQWSSYGGGGLWLNSGYGHKNFWRLGWQLQKELNTKWTLGGEIFQNTGSETGAASDAFYNLGGYWKVDGANQILFSIGHSLNRSDESIGYIGILLTGARP
jgi:hypothetical protein